MPPTPLQVQAKQKAQASGQVAKAGAAAEALAPVAAAEDEDSTSSTIYVKNLAFSSTEAGLEKHFGKVGRAGDRNRGCVCVLHVQGRHVSQGQYT